VDTELDELKQQSIDATEIWKIAGKPRSGTVNSNRIRIKLSYKNAIKEAASNADSNFNDDLYNRLCQKETILYAKCETNWDSKW